MTDPRPEDLRARHHELMGPLRPRRPEDFDAMYRATPPWDIGRPQPAFVALADAGAIHGRVLDIGCGTGEHTLMAARLGLDATGVDASPRAIEGARRKAADRGLSARFVVADALRLPSLGAPFDTVLDCGLFHVFEDDDRATYDDSLREVTDPGSRYFMLCFSDRQPGDWGPRRLTQAEIRASFNAGWRIDGIEPARLEIVGGPPVEAWLASLTRV